MPSGTELLISGKDEKNHPMHDGHAISALMNTEEGRAMRRVRPANRWGGGHRFGKAGRSPCNAVTGLQEPSLGFYPSGSRGGNSSLDCPLYGSHSWATS